jgi:hypothetical protein
MSGLGSGLSKPKWDVGTLIKFEKNFYVYVWRDFLFWKAFFRRLTPSV